MPFFETEMPQIKLGDLDNIPCTTRKVSGGRAIVQREYPNRDGASSEDLGREPYTFELEIPLFRDVDETHYPDLWDALKSLLDSPPDSLEYRDHELGTMHVSIGPWSSDLTASKRDGVILQLTLKEDDLDIAGSFREIAARSPNVQAAGAELDQALEDAGVDESALKKKLDKAGVGLSAAEQGFAVGNMWSTQAVRFTEGVNDVIATADYVAARVDTMRGRVDVLFGLAQLQRPENAAACTAAILFIDAIALFGDVVLASSTPIVEEPIVVTTSVFEISARLYGTTERAQEIMLRNPLVDPLFIRPGTKLLVAA